MIHFHHQTTFQVLPSIAILTHSETKEISFTNTTGRWRVHSFQNYSINTDNITQHFVLSPLFGSAFHLWLSTVSWTQKLQVFNHFFFARKILSSIYHVYSIPPFLGLRAADILCQLLNHSNFSIREASYGWTS